MLVGGVRWRGWWAEEEGSSTIQVIEERGDADAGGGDRVAALRSGRGAMGTQRAAGSRECGNDDCAGDRLIPCLWCCAGASSRSRAFASYPDAPVALTSVPVRALQGPLVKASCTAARPWNLTEQ
eukprot:3655699-Prymnesium_polylepis.1